MIRGSLHRPQLNGDCPFPSGLRTNPFSGPATSSTSKRSGTSILAGLTAGSLVQFRGLRLGTMPTTLGLRRILPDSSLWSFGPWTQPI
jgi:hypothetical protein